MLTMHSTGSEAHDNGLRLRRSYILRNRFTENGRELLFRGFHHAHCRGRDGFWRRPLNVSNRPVESRPLSMDKMSGVELVSDLEEGGI